MPLHHLGKISAAKMRPALDVCLLQNFIQNKLVPSANMSPFNA